LQKVRLAVLTIAVFIALSCHDYDISDVVDDSYVFARDSIVSTRLPSDADTGIVFHKSAGLASRSNSSSPMHAPGQRNMSTAWFFNQPWAARFIWKKMLRDSIVLLVISFVIVFLSRQKER
jgi:hypothetical protein